MGAGAAAQLVAGDDFRGGLHDKQVVIKYEHLAACAKRCRSEHRISMFHEVALCYPEQVGLSLEVCSYRGDATNQEAIQHEKVHTNLISSMMGHCPTQALYEDSFGPYSSFVSQLVHHVSEAGDLQIVHHGTGKETFS